ncbi:threonine--tRNA ligase [Candidatus Kaiserbacteria bacterium]|nr:threonine--tRNA ligase [Candidatus Kaiserbacteria bacterium]
MNDKPKESLDHIRHTLAHLLAASVRELYPGAKNAIGPAVEDGFYQDFELPSPISESDLPKIEEKMREKLKSWTAFERREVSAEEAKKEFSWNEYKCELIDEFAGEGKTLTFYTIDGFIDLCKGGHAEHPAQDIAPDSFKLDRVAGAYWRGDETKPMLTRIYGLAFETKEALDAYLRMQEEAKKRDHRKLGRELDLFATSDLVGSGLPLFTPKGTILREEINAFSQGLRLARGFQKVWIPHITKNDLYKVSGHWDKFGHELFLVKSQETKDQFVLKPMNCPHHQQIYVSRPRSYRDLPIRYMSTTEVYRDEKTGELGGLSRVRAITQDDSHIFCTVDQIESEYQSIMEMVVEFYRVMGMQFRARLSFRDPAEPEKYLGDEALWERAQSQLENIAKSSNFEYFIAPGEAAFYGPKIDFMAMDAIGREHQLATGQLDFVQPARFGLVYTDTDGKDKMPVMIHLAIAGSLERFLSVYIEHTAGNFPLWLSPVQAAVLPIGEHHMAFAQEVSESLKAAGIRAELDERNETLGKKIRDWKLSKSPYALVIGDKEVEGKQVTIESRDNGKLGESSVDALIERLKKEITEKK